MKKAPASKNPELLDKCIAEIAKRTVEPKQLLNSLREKRKALIEESKPFTDQIAAIGEEIKSVQAMIGDYDNLHADLVRDPDHRLFPGADSKTEQAAKLLGVE